MADWEGCEARTESSEGSSSNRHCRECEGHDGRPREPLKLRCARPPIVAINQAQPFTAADRWLRCGARYAQSGPSETTIAAIPAAMLSQNLTSAFTAAPSAQA